jgi:hypothetical protein
MAIRQVMTGIFQGRDQISDDIVRIDRNLANMEKRQGAVASALRGPAGMILAAGAAAGALAGLGRELTRVADDIDRVAKFSQRLNILPQTLKEIEFAGQKMGANLTSIDTILQRIARRSGQAAGGQKLLAKAFRDVGVELTDTSGQLKTADKLLLEISKTLSTLPDRSKAAGLLFPIGDLEGAGALPLLLQGPEKIKESMEKYRELRGTLTQEEIDAAADLKDARLELKTAWDGVIEELTLGIAPALAGIAERLSNVLARMRQENEAGGISFGRGLRAGIPPLAVLEFFLNRRAAPGEAAPPGGLPVGPRFGNLAAGASGIAGLGGGRFVNPMFLRGVGGGATGALGGTAQDLAIELDLLSNNFRRLNQETGIERRDISGLRPRGLRGDEHGIGLQGVDFGEGIRDIAESGTLQRLQDGTSAVGDTMGLLVDSTQSWGDRVELVGQRWQRVGVQAVSALSQIIAKLLLANILLSLFPGSGFVKGIAGGLGLGRSAAPRSSADPRFDAALTAQAYMREISRLILTGRE